MSIGKMLQTHRIDSGIRHRNKPYSRREMAERIDPKKLPNFPLSEPSMLCAENRDWRQVYQLVDLMAIYRFRDITLLTKILTKRFNETKELI